MSSYELESVNGAHAHSLARGHASTLEDGRHAHVFKMADGTLLYSSHDGDHKHDLESSLSSDTEVGEPHFHLVVFPDGTEVRTSTEETHTHDALLESTSVDGAHIHTMEAAGETIKSVTLEEYLAATGLPKKKTSLATLAELLERELFIEGACRADIESSRTYRAKCRASLLSALRKASREGDRLLVETPEETITIETSKGQLKNLAPTLSPEHPAIAFVGSAPSKLDCVRGEPFTGMCGETLRKQFLEPLGLKREQVALMNIVPQCTEGKPSSEEIELWKSAFEADLEELKPRVIVALGKSAREYLGDRADIYAPHPNGVRSNHDSGECSRKVKHIRKRLEEQPIRIEKAFEMAETDDEQRVITGIVLEPETEDGHGDLVSVDEIAQAAYNFVIQSRVIGDSHTEIADAELVESYLAPVDFELGGHKVKKGTWIVSVHVLDDALWADAKAGHFNGFSIGGFAVKEPA